MCSSYKKSQANNRPNLRLFVLTHLCGIIHLERKKKILLKLLRRRRRNSSFKQVFVL